jgi:hypothetical protein
MFVKHLVFGAAAGSVLLGGASARAQEAIVPPDRDAYMTERVPAPSRAFELTVGGSYTQGFGMLQKGIGIADVAHAGAGVDIGLRHRATPHFSWGLDGQYFEMSPTRGPSARGVSAGLDFTFHGAPFEVLDPWIQFGPGYRMIWQGTTMGPTMMTHGIQLARVAIGIDLNTGENVAFGPVVGGDLDVFMWQSRGGGPTVEITDPKLSTFIFAGLQGRFDFGGTRGVGGHERVIFDGR